MKRLENVKVKIEQLCGHDLLKDANLDVCQQLQECAKLCDSAEKMLTKEYQELEAERAELMNNAEELKKQLESLEQKKKNSAAS